VGANFSLEITFAHAPNDMWRILEVSVIGKLWRGQYSLPIAFWVFYVVGYFGSVVLTWVVSPVFGAQPWRMLSVLAIVWPYNIVSAVGVLQNSESGCWPTLASKNRCLSLGGSNCVVSCQRYPARDQGVGTVMSRSSDEASYTDTA
jgi:hypothetical protein